MKKTEKLSEKGYWDKVHENAFFLPLRNIFQGLQEYDLFRRTKPAIKKNARILEVGCAPGNYLIKFAKKYELEAYGVEYSKIGVEKTKTNLKQTGVKANIILADFFDKKFQKKYYENFDIVYSLGFIEHFDKPENVVKQHFNLVKKGGFVIITIPNLKYINKFFADQKILDIHNLTIMSPQELRKLIPKKHTIKYVGYSGGFFNIGLYHYENKIKELIRTTLFYLQRLIVDPLAILLRKSGCDFRTKYSSPQIMVIAQKK